MLASPAERQLLALHLSPPVDREAYRAGLDVEQTAAALQPLLAQAKNEKIDIEPVSFVSRDVPDDIASVARSRQADLVLMGFHRPVFGRSVLGRSDNSSRISVSENPNSCARLMNRNRRAAFAGKTRYPAPVRGGFGISPSRS